MARRFTFKRSEVALAALLLSTVCIPSAFAQGPGGPPPDGNGRPGFGGPGGPGGGQPPFGGPNGGQVSVAQVPISALEAGLKLTPDQKTKIAKIQKDAQAQRRSLFPRFGQGPGGPGGPPPGGQDDQQGGPGGPPPGGPGGQDGQPQGGPGGPPPGGQDGQGGPGGPGGPDSEDMRAAMDKMRNQEQQVKSKIEAVLTSDQKQALPGFLKEIQAFRATGIPAEVYGDLKLTDAQRKKLVALGKQSEETTRQMMDKARDSGDFESVRSDMDTSRRQMHSKALTILTADQRSTVQKYQQAHPRAQRGPGGFGGPGGPGGPGEGPDGPGGPGGPPPGGDGDGQQ